VTQRPWARELRAVAAQVPTKIAEHYAGLSRACKVSAEKNEEVITADGDSPCDPIVYLASNEEAFLNAILQGIAVGRFDLAAETIRNLGPLYEIRSHLVYNNDDRWSDIFDAVSKAAEKSPDDELHGITLIQLSRRDRVLCRWDSAREHAIDAVCWYAARADNRFRLEEAYALECLGEVHRAIGTPADLDEAIRRFQAGLTCVAVADAAEDDRRLAELKLRDRLGYAFYLRGYSLLAVKEFSRAIRPK
jgi:tetratricopeptide (TPR) repeat protein